jgi:hypothetical protein
MTGKMVATTPAKGMAAQIGLRVTKNITTAMISPVAAAEAAAAQFRLSVAAWVAVPTGS